MRMLTWLFPFCLWVAGASAAGNTSVYTEFDLDKTCKKIEAGDQYVHAGTWRCPGYKGIDVIQSNADERSYVGFGKNGAQHCAFKKTFERFNTALSPIEWRLKNGKAFAAIERWQVQTDDEGGQVTWLVITALRQNESCHVHYIAGSYPDANAHARVAADDLAEDFDCANDAPTVDSKVGEPGIEFFACKDTAAE
jgi:hypothetical protein